MPAAQGRLSGLCIRIAQAKAANCSSGSGSYSAQRPSSTAGTERNSSLPVNHSAPSGEGFEVTSSRSASLSLTSSSLIW